MALATLSPESQINQILAVLDCAVSNFAGIADKLSGGRVAAALSGANSFTAPDGVHYLSVARAMKRLADEFPVPIDWKKCERVRLVLESRQQTTRPVPFAVIMLGYSLFKRIDASGKVETTSSYQECAAFASPVLASQAAKLLDSIYGQPQVRTTTITNEQRDPEGFTENLSDLGL